MRVRVCAVHARARACACCLAIGSASEYAARHLHQRLGRDGQLERDQLQPQLVLLRLQGDGGRMWMIVIGGYCETIVREGY